MRQGKLEQIAAPDELYTEPATAFVAEFVGVMNRIPGELAGGGTVAALGGAVPVKGDGGAALGGEKAVDVLVRPEGLRMELVEGGNGIVTTRTFLGSVTRSAFCWTATSRFTSTSPVPSPGSDSILAAPLVLDLVLFSDLAQRAGM